MYVFMHQKIIKYTTKISIKNLIICVFIFNKTQNMHKKMYFIFKYQNILYIENSLIQFF